MYLPLAMKPNAISKLGYMVPDVEYNKLLRNLLTVSSFPVFLNVSKSLECMLPIRDIMFKEAEGSVIFEDLSGFGRLSFKEGLGAIIPNLVSGDFVLGLNFNSILVDSPFYNIKVVTQIQPVNFVILKREESCYS